MRVEREVLLHALQSVQPGLASRAVRGYETCFCFVDGNIYTYNEEIACRIPSPFGEEITGEIQSEKLLAQLGKWTEDTIECELDGTILKVIGKGGRKASFNMENEISLPVNEIEKPKKWSKINETFSEAVNFVQQCAGKDESEFALTCVNITPKFVEAHNNFQLCRWRLKTGFTNQVLVRQAAMKHVAVLGLTEVSETEGWIHFKGDSGLVLSCRRYIMDYKELDQIIDNTHGDPTTFPRGLVEATERAAIMLDNVNDGGLVLVELRQGKLRISGEGVRGKFEEPKKVAYDGKPLSFLVPPALLIDLVKKHNECFISEDKLKVTNGSYTYISVLTKPKEADEPEEESEDE